MKKRRKLQNRIFVYFSLLIVLSTLWFGLYAYRANVDSAEENFTKLISGNLSQTAGNVRAVMDTTEKQSALFSYSYIVQNVLTKRSPSLVEQYDDYKILDSLINSFEKNNEWLSIKLYADTSNRFLQDNVHYFRLADEPPAVPGQSELLVRSNRQMSWRAIWTAPRQSAAPTVVMSCVSKVISMGDIGQNIATVEFNLNEQAFVRALSNMDMPSIRKAYMLDGSGTVLASADGSGIGLRVFPDSINRTIAENRTGRLVAKNNLIVYRTVQGTPFLLAAEVPLATISNRSDEILKNFILIALAILIVSFLLAYVISANITGRIKKLITAMGTLEQNEFQTQVQLAYNDEIGILIQKFNMMVERIRFLIKNVYQANLEKQTAELNLLQAQINPHFLYNTLDSINWLALKHRETQISYMIRNLSDFLRYSLNSDRCTTLATELRHLQSYFNIQKFRFEDRINLKIDVPEALNSYEIQALVLQPLVENAIVHGILAEGDRDGTITVRGSLQDGLVLLEVVDDGKGMPRERLLQVQRRMSEIKPDEQASNGRGLRNVHQRIRIRYGEAYGVNMTSFPGRGTQCSVIFPAIPVNF